MSPPDDPKIPNLSHVSPTRFNLPTLGPKRRVRARTGLLRARRESFTRFDAPSVPAQAERNFEWVVCFDSESPQSLSDEIANLQEPRIVTTLFRTTGMRLRLQEGTHP